MVYGGWDIEYRIEKGRDALYRDFVTVLRGASMQYITKLVTKSRNPGPPSPNFII
jgi:hypothetical protein